MLKLAFFAGYLGVPAMALALVLWARARALAPRGEKIEAWFPFVRRVRTIGALAVYTSILFNFSLYTDDFMMRAFGIWWMNLGVGGIWTLIFLPALATQLMVAYHSHSVALRLGTSELTWAEVSRQAGWSAAAFFCVSFGLSGILSSAEVILDGGARLMALWVLAAAAGGAFCAARLRRAIGLTPHAVTHGALRDRLFALADRAGVRLRQLYLLPMKRMRLANAFAVQNGVVMVSDLLLEQLERQEVDAVLAHEIAHMREQHPLKLGLIRSATLTVAIVAAIVLRNWVPALAVVALGAVVFAAVARAFERTADRDVPRLGASGESLITALVKLARLNHVPISWSRWTGWLLNHPSVSERAARIGAELGLAPERVRALLAWAPPSMDRYPVTLSARASTKLFSTPFKHAALLRNGLLLLAVSAFLPALVARMALPLAPGDRDWTWLGALVATPAACVLLLEFVALAPLRGMRDRLRSKLMPGAPSTSAGAESPVLVGLGPHADPRTYEGFASWDLGFVRIENGCLRYQGEEASFALAPGNVLSVELTKGAASWIPTRAVLVRWRDRVGEERAFRLTPLASRRLSGISRKARALHQRLDLWRREGASIGSVATGEGSPPTGEVTSVAPREQLKARYYLRLVVLSAAAGAIACAIVGAPFWPAHGMGFLEVSLTSFLAQAFLAIPAARHRAAQARQESSETRERAAA